MRNQILDEFAAARWKSSEEQREFISKVLPVTAEEVVKLLDSLGGKRAVVGSHEQDARIRIFLELAQTVKDPMLSEYYLRSLKIEDKSLRLALSKLLLQTENPQIRPKICALLKSPDGSLRMTAAQILRKFNNPASMRYIVEMFRERGFAGRNESIDLAGALPGAYSIELFKLVIDSGNPFEKARTLKHLQSPEYLKGNSQMILNVVRPALNDKDESVVATAIAVFAKLCSEEEYFDRVGDYLYSKNLNMVKAVIENLHNFNTERVFSALMRKLYTGPHLVRLTVLNTIERIGGGDVLKILLKALEHRNQQLRARAREVLLHLTQEGRLKVEDAIALLIRSKSPEVKQIAVKLAASLPEGSADIWAPVLDQVLDEDWWERQQMVEALVGMTGDVLVPHVEKHLQDPSCIVRLFCLDLLKNLKSRRSVPAVLKSAQEDEEWWVRERAIEVLAEINEPKVIPVIMQIGVSEPDYQVAVVEALNRMKATDETDRIVSFMLSENPAVRIAVLRFLDQLDLRSHGHVVVPALRDPDLNVRSVAKDLVKKWHIDDDSSDVVAVRDERMPMIDKLLIATRNAEGDDLILLPEQPPAVKRHGGIMPISKNKITPEQMQAILMPILSAQQQSDLHQLRDIDFSYHVASEGLRFRANIFKSRTGLSGVFRIIKGHIWKLEELGLPPVVNTFGDFKNGLVLVGGPTGSGKSTTLSTIIDYINCTSRRHVISIEDPIETLHRSKMGLVNQREVGVHTPTFGHALKMTLRDDPDVILIGELRDLSTIQYAVTAAETGHLVFGTVHTVSADSSVDRLINAYPAESQEQVRSMLADSLRAVLCQYLIREKGSENSRVLASEIMINTSAISNLIRKGKTFQIPSMMVTAREQQMQTMDYSLMELYKQGKITADEAYLKARSKSEFEGFVNEAGLGSLAPENETLRRNST